MSNKTAHPPLPEWATRKTMSLEMRKRQVLRFLFNYAALQYGHNVSLRQLSADCGYHETAINTAIVKIDVSPELATAVASIIGANFDAQWLLDPRALLK